MKIGTVFKVKGNTKFDLYLVLWLKLSHLSYSTPLIFAQFYVAQSLLKTSRIRFMLISSSWMEDKAVSYWR